MVDDRRRVIYQGVIYRVGIPYDYRLELIADDGSKVLVTYADPDLIRQPTPEQISALTPKKRKKR